jgi:LPXTG-motif cell wall-anchored protein
VALDGHLLRGTWTFTVAAAPTASPSPIATAVSSSVATPGPSAAGTTGSDSSDVALPIIVALIILGAGAAYLLGRRNRPAAPT